MMQAAFVGTIRRHLRDCCTACQARSGLSSRRQASSASSVIDARAVVWTAATDAEDDRRPGEKGCEVVLDGEFGSYFVTVGLWKFET